MKKKILNNFLDLSIKRKNKLTKMNFFSRLIFFPSMVSQSILCFFLVKLNLSFPYKINTFWGKRMKVILPEVISSDLRRFGFIEDSVASFIINNCSKGNTVIDVGSHFGFFSLLMSEVVGNDGNVHCFEPTPSTFSILKRNVFNMKNVFINQKAVLDKEIEIQLNDYGLASSAFNSINNSREKKRNYKFNQSKISVKTIRLDDYVLSNKLRPSLIKIDAESSEYRVLKGMDYILNKIRPILCIELGDLNVDDVKSSREIINFLIKRYGYKPYEIINGKLTPHNLREKYGFINLFFKF
tara:strand:- start:15527 stop:16417 length:891 start_codon:yes stop_codon:yes gene_type:complete